MPTINHVVVKHLSYRSADAGSLLAQILHNFTDEGNSLLKANLGYCVVCCDDGQYSLTSKAIEGQIRFSTLEVLLDYILAHLW